MIRLIRRQLTDKGFRIILWVCVASFMFASIVPHVLRRFSRGGEGVLAKINGLELSVSEYAKKVKQEQDRLADLREQYGPYADQLLALFGMSSNPEEIALQALQQEKIIDSAANKIGLEISPEYVMARLQDPNFARSLGIDPLIDALGNIDMQKLKESLRRRGMSMSDFEDGIESQIRRTVVLNIAEGAAHTPEFMIRQRFIQDFVSRKYNILVFSPEYYLAQAKKEAVSDEELKKFFDKENRMHKRYRIDEKRSGLFWVFDPASYGLEVSNEELETKYNRNKKNYLVSPESITVNKLVFEIPEGTSSDEIRKRAENELQELKKNPKKFPTKNTETYERSKTKEAALSRAAFALKNDGEISDVIKAKEGFVILKRVKHNDAQYKSLAEVKDTIKDGLLQDKFKRRFPQDARKAIGEETVQALVKAQNAPENMIADQEKTGDPLSSKLFALGLNKYGYIFDNGQGYIVQVTDIQKAHLPQFDEVKDKVRGDYYEQAASKALHSAVDDAYSRITENNDSLVSIAEQPGVSLTTTGFIAKDDTDALQKLNDKGIPTSSMLALTTPNSLRKEVNDRGGFIIQLDEIAAIDEEKYEEEKGSIMSMLERQMQQITQGGFVASLTKNAKIEMYAPISKRKQ